MSRNPDRCPTHPGELLREDLIPATGKPEAEIARMLAISRQNLHEPSANRQPRDRPAPGQAVREHPAGLDQDAGRSWRLARHPDRRLSGWRDP